MSAPPDPKAASTDLVGTPSMSPTGLPETSASEPKRSVKTAWKRLRTRVIAPDPDDDKDNRFPQTQDELFAQLRTDDPQRATEILAEANEIANRLVAKRIDGVERRAATLQSATAIAGSFSLAGGALVVTDVKGAAWQIIIGALLLWVTLNLGLCGWRATQAAADIHRFVAEPAQDILNRPSQTSAQASIQRAARTLRVAGFNARFARFKVTMLKRAGRHLARATLGLPLIVAAVLAYVIAHPNNGPHKPALSSRAAPAHAHRK